MDPDLIRPLLRCSVCNIPLSNPTTLRCGHSICSKHNSCTLHNPPIDSEKKVDVSLQKIIALVNRQSVASESRSRDDDENNEDSDERPSKRARTMPEEEDSDEEDLLAHLRSESARQRTIRHDEPLLPSGSLPLNNLDSFEKDLVTELSCEICFSLLYEPVTTPCQHTFCSRCLHRSLDHSSVCPICRQQLPGFAYFQNHPCNELMLRIILHTCPSVYQDRGDAIEAEEHNVRLSTPIFVCQLSFPGMPTLLHFFEPKYRLMLRRCLASPSPAFGMIMSSSASSSSASSSNLTASDQIEYGTMLEIRSVQMLPDGRSMVETWGGWRFRILERGLMDGYVVARIERIDDIPDEEGDDDTEEPLAVEVPSAGPSTLQRLTSRLTGSSSPSSDRDSVSSNSRATTAAAAQASDVDSSSASTSQAPSILTPTSEPLPGLPGLPLSTCRLVEHCNSFLAQLHTSTTPWVVQRLSYTHGPPPPSDPSDPAFDPGAFSFYVGMVLPIDDWEKAKLLPVRSVRMRLKMCVWWIEGLRQNWWFERGCVVL
ncbi:PUA-like domain-containing protein [Rhodocollybia butyracea]|uniref:PUA-like domain-containing protein n=1 Tax=Rhodocollybia butyracea TaxID=206335 RepID=A0A9P5Q751_9AGAR|nr:PUA-like domain-containing protein [Rhodocollybia butyracea]